MEQSGSRVVSTIEPPLAGFARPTFRESARTLLLTLAVCVAGAFLFPVPETKLVLGAILGLLYLRSLNEDMALGLSLVAFSVPVQDLTPSYIRLAPGMNIATVVMVLLLLFWWKHEVEGTGNPAERPSFPLGPAFACFAAAGALAIGQSWLLGNDPLGYLIILFKDQFGFMVLTIVAFRTLAKQEQRWLVFTTIVCIDFLVSIHSVLSYGAGVRERSTGLIGAQPNLYGGFLAMQIPFLVALFVSGELSKRVRVIVGVLLLAVLQALVLTGSRGAWVAAAIGMLILALVGNRRALPVLLVGYLLMPMFFYGFNQERLQSLGQIVRQDPALEEAPDPSFEYRVNVWANVGELVTAPYVWGQGFATSNEALQKAGILKRKKAVHSSIIALAVEMGLIGVGLYFWILLVLWRTARQHLKVSRQGLGAVLAAGFIGAIPTLIVCDLSGQRFQNGEIMAYFWLLGGLLLREASAVRVAPAPPPHGQVETVLQAEGSAVQ